MKHNYNKEVKDIIKNIQSYENEESCIIILSQEQNKALLNYINTLEKDNGDIIKLFAKEREETKRLHNLLQEIKEYVNVELLSSNADYYRKNGGYVSGSDLDVDYIFPILDILDKENK